MAGERFLVVDDDPFMRELVTEALTEAGYEPVPAHAGHDALHALSLNEFDSAIVDLSLEDTDGLTLIDAILDTSPTTQIIIITGYPSLRSAIEALRRGAQDYLIKPFKLPELQAAVTRCLKNQKLEAEVRELRRRVREQDQELARLRTGAQPPAAPRPAGGRPTGLPGAYGATRPAAATGEATP